MTKHNKQIIKSVARECLIRQIGAMNAGQCIQLERQTFFDAFPVFQTVFGPWHKYSGFYNSIIGSATTYRVSDSLEIGHIFIERVNAPEGADSMWIKTENIYLTSSLMEHIKETQYHI